MLWMTHVELLQDIAAHSHDVHEFVVCLEGMIHVTMHDETHALSSGQSIFIPSEIEHEITLEGGGARLLFSCVDLSSFESFMTPTNIAHLRKLSDGKCNVSNGANTQVFSEVLRVSGEVISLLDIDSPLQACLKENLYLNLLYLHLSGHDANSNIEDQAALRIVKAKAWIDDHFTEDITLDQLARHVNMSRSHFSRQFRLHMGSSMVDYLLKVRCDTVANRLIDSSMDVSEIAFAAGFSNLSHFYRHFKKRYGTTPRAFRQTIRNQGVELTV